MSVNTNESLSYTAESGIPQQIQTLAARVNRIDELLRKIDQTTQPPIFDTLANPNTIVRRDSNGVIYSQNFGAVMYGGGTNTLGTSGTYTALTFDTTRSQVLPGCWNALAPTKFYAQVDGLYLCECHVIFPSNTTGDRRLSFRVDGTTFWKTTSLLPMTGGFSTPMGNVGVVKMSAGSYVEFMAYQSSGGSMTLTVSSGQSVEAAFLLL